MVYGILEVRKYGLLTTEEMYCDSHLCKVLKIVYYN